MQTFDQVLDFLDESINAHELWEGMGSPTPGQSYSSVKTSKSVPRNNINAIAPRKNTVKCTNYGKRAFCEWWAHARGTFFFPDTSFPDSVSRENFRLMDGVDAFLQMSLLQRATVCVEFVAGVQPADRKTCLTAKTIKGMLDGFFRHIHAIENESEELTAKFGDWSFKSKPFVKVKEALKNYEMNRYIACSENPGQQRVVIAADVLQPFAFAEIHKRTLYLAACSTTHRAKLMHIQKATAQVIGNFLGARAISELHEVKVTDFYENGPNWMEYRPSGVTKTTKVNQEFQVTQRYPGFIVGRKNCDLIRLLVSHRSEDSPNRLFLRPLNNVEEHHDYWFANQHVGVNQISSAISQYTLALIEGGRIPCGHYTNTSMRKLVADRLSNAGAPEMIVASAIGHYGSTGGQTNVGFNHRNLGNYISGCKDSLTRQKIAVLMHNCSLKWRDVEDDEFFFQNYVVNSKNGPEGIDVRPLEVVLASMITPVNMYPLHKLV